MWNLGTDIRRACRTLLAHPGFSLVAIVSLGLGIGANTAIFSFIDTVIFEHLPVKDPGSLVLFGEGRRRGHSDGAPQGLLDIFSWRHYRDFQNSGVFADIIAAQSYSDRVYPSIAGASGENTQGLDGGLVSGNFFDVLGVRPAAGRLFDASMDDSPSPVIVLSDAFWERAFHRDSAVLGRVARIGARDYTIIGIAPATFFGIRPGIAPDVWIPLSMQPALPGQADWLKMPNAQFLNLIGRLRPRQKREQAEAAINVVLHQNMRTYLAGVPVDAKTLDGAAKARIVMTSAARGISSLRRTFEEPLRILMWVVALVLAIAAANVANLVMALNAKRQKEFALRTAIGASRAQLIRMVLTESVLLAAASGALGMFIASEGARILVHLISTGPRSLPVAFHTDARVLAFTLAVSLGTGLLFGMAPALRGTQPDLTSALKESRSSMASPRKVTFGRAMVVSQVALSMALLVACGLLLRTFENLTRKSLGFDREHVLVAQIDTVATGYNGDQRLVNIYHRIEDRISRLPGVLSAALCHRVFNEGQWAERFSVPGLAVPDAQRTVAVNFASPSFFRALGIPLLQGRGFSRADDASSPRVVVVNETMAKSVFGGANAIGRTIMMSPITDNDVPYRIIGIARDTQDRNVTDAPGNMAWAPLEQNPVFAGDIAVRVAGDPMRVAPQVREAIRSVDVNLPIHWITTLSNQVGDSLVTQRAIAQLTAFFAGVALLLAAIGIYGTISFSVARRTSEIGIRMALGAERSTVLGMVLSDAAKLIGAGIVIGLPLAFSATALVRSILYGIGRFDALSIAAAIVVLAACAMIAGYVPARRASRVDPMVALRYE